MGDTREVGGPGPVALPASRVLLMPQGPFQSQDFIGLFMKEWTQQHIKKGLKDVGRDSLNSEIILFIPHRLGE